MYCKYQNKYYLCSVDKAQNNQTTRKMETYTKIENLPTINSTNTVQKLKEMGCIVVTRNDNHHVKFEVLSVGRKYEIKPKSNREYKLIISDNGKEVAANENPLELLKSLPATNL